MNSIDGSPDTCRERLVHPGISRVRYVHLITLKLGHPWNVHGDFVGPETSELEEKRKTHRKKRERDQERDRGREKEAEGGDRKVS